MTAVLQATGISVVLRRPEAPSTRSTSTVAEGQLVGLIGPNGAGKTTFIDAITGFVPYRGRSELDGARGSKAAGPRARRARARAGRGSRSSSSTT